MRRLCTETSRSYLGRSVGRGDVELNRKSRNGRNWNTKAQALRQAASRKRANWQQTAKRHSAAEGISDVTGQKSAAAILAATLLTRKAR